MLEWLYSGVDFSMAGNGGPECARFLSTKQLIIETVVVTLYAIIFELYYPWKRSVFNYKPNLELHERFGRKLLLAGLCLIWGIEIGYKLSTRQLIFILNPCHVITLLQLILLISPARRWMHFMFRINTYVSSCAILAIVFPVLNTRHLPFEVVSYYIHHALMLITPLYLMRLGGIYNMEPYWNFHWALMSIACVRLYHYLVLQPLSFATGVNLNSTMCPAVSDPFNGPFYRIAANLHQIPFIFLFGKCYCFIGRTFFHPKFNDLNTEQILEINKKKNEILRSIENNLTLKNTNLVKDIKGCANCRGSINDSSDNSILSVEELADFGKKDN